MSIEFQPWPKIARLNRDIIITEKIDGTNAAVVITPVAADHPTKDHEGQTLYAHPRDALPAAMVDVDGTSYFIHAQSRTRFITPGKSTDNYGFAAWVERNAGALVKTLGEGTHYGEWWGSSIQRGYGRKAGERSFSLFNTKRWTSNEGLQAIVNSGVPGLDVVPVLYEGPFDQYAISVALQQLRVGGSYAAIGFDRPEGIVVFHTASRESYKVTLEGDAAPKGAAGHALDNEAVAA